MAMQVVVASHYVMVRVRVMVHLMVMVHRPAAVVDLEANHHTNRHCTHHQAPQASPQAPQKQQSSLLQSPGLL